MSVASVELAFGTKAQLLKTAIDVAIAGDHDPVAVLDRDWASAAQATATVEDFLTAAARTLRPAMTRSAGLVLAAFDAAYRSLPEFAIFTVIDAAGPADAVLADVQAALTAPRSAENPRWRS